MKESAHYPSICSVFKEWNMGSISSCNSSRQLKRSMWIISSWVEKFRQPTSQMTAWLKRPVSYFSLAISAAQKKKWQPWSIFQQTYGKYWNACIQLVAQKVLSDGLEQGLCDIDSEEKKKPKPKKTGSKDSQIPPSWRWLATVKRTPSRTPKPLRRQMLSKQPQTGWDEEMSKSAEVHVPGSGFWPSKL